MQGLHVIYKWLANAYTCSVNAHAEDLRLYFVAHEGKKRLLVRTMGDRYSVDYADLSRQFATLIHENVRV